MCRHYGQSQNQNIYVDQKNYACFVLICDVKIKNAMCFHIKILMQRVNGILSGCIEKHKNANTAGIDI